MFDGDCAFCTVAARLLERWSEGRLVVVPWQRVDLGSLGLTQAQCVAAVQLVTVAGRYAGGAAIARALRSCRQPWRAIGRVLSVPQLNAVVERGYRIVAVNRHRLRGATPACHVPSAPGSP